MKHFARLLLSLLLIAGVTLAYADVNSWRAQKLIEEPKDVPTGAIQTSSIDAITNGFVPIFPSTTPSAYTFPGVQALKPTIVWLAGYNLSTSVDNLWRSYDNGASWTNILPPTDKAGFVFTARDSNVVVLATFAGQIIRSTNGGVKWDTVLTYGAGSGYFDGITSVGKDTMVAFGDNAGDGLYVTRSTNAGATWTRVHIPAADSAMLYGYASYRQSMSVYGKTVWLNSYSGSTVTPRIMKSTDAGATWSSWPITLTGGLTNNYYLRSMNFINDSIGFGVDRQIASGSANWLHKTTDGGVTWGDTINVQPSAVHLDIRMTSVKGVPGSGMIVGTGWAQTSAKAYVSNDTGKTWTPFVVPGTDLKNLSFLSSTDGFLGGAAAIVQYTGKNVRKVTFKLNTATVPDTIPVAGSTIQVRGGVSNAGGFSPVTWGNDAQNNMTRIGGDYWTKTVYMAAGDTLRYKYTVAYSTGTGWEQAVVPADFPSQNDNRSLIVPDKDTTLAVEFWNNGASTNPQYFRPWTAVQDSILSVYFRVNLRPRIAAGSFNPPADTVAVRGGGNALDDLNWGISTFLKAESPASNGDGYTIAASDMYSARLRFHKSALTAGQQIQYKFLFNNNWDGREESANRTFTVPVGLKDTTLGWVFYNNEQPLQRANPDTIKITWVANMAQAAASGGVNVLTDTIYVRSGYFTTAAVSGQGKRLARVSGTVFQATDTIVTAKKKLLDYQYYVVRNGVEIRENYYNYTYNGAVTSEAERRQILIDSTASVASGQTVRDTATSIIQARRQPTFPNGRILARNVNVTWTCDLRPAYYQVSPAWGGDTLTDIQGAYTVTPALKDSIMKWGVWINGPAVGGWATWGITLNTTNTQKLYDDGTNGDKVAHDSIYTRRVQAGPDSVIATGGTKGYVGQIYKFGILGGDNEGGKGGFGNNHAANIVDTDSIYTIATDFGSINPAFYDAWDYDLHKPKKPTSVFEQGKPLTYVLAQNYPNPFNPTTKIEYSIPAQAKVELRVYNIVGQQVATLVSEVQAAGTYHVKFEGLNLASGVYFYRLTAGDFVSVKKMVLLK